MYYTVRVLSPRRPDTTAHTLKNVFGIETPADISDTEFWDTLDSGSGGSGSGGSGSGGSGSGGSGSGGSGSGPHSPESIASAHTVGVDLHAHGLFDEEDAGQTPRRRRADRQQQQQQQQRAGATHAHTVGVDLDRYGLPHSDDSDEPDDSDDADWEPQPKRAAAAAAGAAPAPAPKERASTRESRPPRRFSRMEAHKQKVRGGGGNRPRVRKAPLKKPKCASKLFMRGSGVSAKAGWCSTGAPRPRVNLPHVNGYTGPLSGGGTYCEPLQPGPTPPPGPPPPRSRDARNKAARAAESRNPGSCVAIR